MAKSVGSLFVRLGLDSKKFQSGLNQAETRTKGLGKSAISAGKLIAGALAGAAVIAGIKRLSSSILDTGLEFEKTMKTVQAYSGATGVQLDNLTQSARDMGATTEWSAAQSAESLKYLASAGFTAEQSIAALPGTLDLATAGQVDLGIAADITTDTLTAFGLEVQDIGRVNDAFITTISSSNTNVEMLGESMKYVSATSSQMGYSVEQTTSMLGVLANSGIKASMAGTNLQQALMRSAKAAKALGLDAGTPLIEVLKEMKEQQWGMNDITKNFGIIAAKSVSVLMNNVEAYEKLHTKVVKNKGATQDLADVMRDSLGNEIKELNSIIESQLLDAFDKLKEHIKGTTTAAIDMTKIIGPTFVDIIVKSFEGVSWVIKSFVYSYVEMGKWVNQVLYGIAASAKWVFEKINKLPFTDFDNVVDGLAGIKEGLSDSVKISNDLIAALYGVSQAVPTAASTTPAAAQASTTSASTASPITHTVEKESLDALITLYNKEEEEAKTRQAAWTERQNERKAIIGQYGDEYKAAKFGQFEYEKMLIDEKYAKMSQVFQDESVLVQAAAKEHEKLESRKAIASNNFFAGFKYGLLDTGKNMKTWGEHGASVARKFSMNASNALGDGFFDLVTTGCMDMQKLWKNVWQSILKSVLDALAQMLVKIAIVKAAQAAISIGSGGFLGGVFHDGGIVRAHSGMAVGLKNDEIPIIAQTGEGILSRKGMQNLGGPGVLNALNRGTGQTSTTNTTYNEYNFYVENMNTDDTPEYIANIMQDNQDRLIGPQFQEAAAVTAGL